MSETELIEIRFKPDSLEMPGDGEIALFAAILPELMQFMQQTDEAED